MSRVDPLEAIRSRVGVVRSLSAQPKTPPEDPYEFDLRYGVAMPPAAVVDVDSAMRLGRGLPEELRAFWSACAGVELAVDKRFRQWGCRLLAPAAVLELATSIADEAYRGLTADDVVVGECLGDMDLVIIDTVAASCGAPYVMVALPLDKRADWPCVPNLTAFLDGWLAAPRGRKFWG
jgi:hypothetical protein